MFIFGGWGGGRGGGGNSSGGGDGSGCRQKVTRARDILQGTQMYITTYFAALDRLLKLWSLSQGPLQPDSIMQLRSLRSPKTATTPYVVVVKHAHTNFAFSYRAAGQWTCVMGDIHRPQQLAHITLGRKQGSLYINIRNPIPPKVYRIPNIDPQDPK